jgi:hypothetical protein
MRTNPQTANHTPHSRDPGRRRVHDPNNLSGPSTSQPWHPSGELPSRSRARCGTTKSLPRSRGGRPLGQISASLEGWAPLGRISASLEGPAPPRANLRLTRGPRAPSGESPPRSRAPRPLGRISASLEGLAPPLVNLRLARGDDAPSRNSLLRSRPTRARDTRAHSPDQSIKCSDMPRVPGSNANPRHAGPLTPPGNHISAPFRQPSP